MSYIYTNRASAQLATGLNPSDVNMSVQTGHGVTFPVPGGGDVAQLTLVATDGTHEIVSCTSRVGDNFVIVRGQEGTPAGTFSAGSRVELRLTAATLNSFLPKTGGQMQGGIDFAYHRNTNFLATNANIEYVANRAIAGIDGNFNACIEFPSGGAYPRIQGSKLLTWRFLAQAIFIYYGGIEFLPFYFKICDGTNGTPDLRDKFVICAGPQHPQFTNGGDFGIYMLPAGKHNHGGGVVGTQLEPQHLPPINPLPMAKAYAEATWLPGLYPEEKNKRWFLTNADVYGYQGAGAHHGHAIGDSPGNDGEHQHSGAFKPPYFALYYVMLNENAFN